MLTNYDGVDLILGGLLLFMIFFHAFIFLPYLDDRRWRKQQREMKGRYKRARKTRK